MNILNIIRKKEFKQAVDKFEIYIDMNKITEISFKTIQKYFDNIGYGSSVFLKNGVFHYEIMEMEFAFFFDSREECEINLINKLFELSQIKIDSGYMEQTEAISINYNNKSTECWEDYKI